ncbi:MAG TPA: 4-hydroxy-tetrahydrodipicolinate reductase [Burkholderiales bacterium]|jgi:4-hydroxy-tetrahydrodipicolinate reductase|nr:4-hydroxy-tetrahydrodipicolinate reductase [Burkholderiales bacterium]
MKVAIAGAGGRMGRALIESVLADRELTLAAAFDAPGSAAIGQGAGALRISADLGALADADVLVDFTRPEGTLAHLEACLKLNRRMVIGTTGFSEAQAARIAEAARRIPIVLSPNFAIGVNVVFRLAQTAAKALGDAYDVEIVEAHHRHKVDAPSGTALKLGELVAQALGRDLGKVATHGRHGDTGERAPKAIGFHAIRGGDIVGEHTVMFAGQGERVEVAVRSQSRSTYAAGALRAAKWLAGRGPGLYDMFDVLGLK